MQMSPRLLPMNQAAPGRWVQHKTHPWMVHEEPGPSGTKLLHRFQTPMAETGLLEICLSAPWKSTGPVSSTTGCEGYRCRNVPLRHLNPPGEAAALLGVFFSASESREGQQEHCGSILSTLQLGGSGAHAPAGSPTRKSSTRGTGCCEMGPGTPERCPGIWHLPWKCPCP